MKYQVSALMVIITLTTFGAFAQHSPSLARKVDLPEKTGAMISQYQYIGNVPRFSAGDLEITMSKMMLTLRVKAWVKEELINSYRSFLYNRWKKIDESLRTTTMEIVPLTHPNQVIEKVTDPKQKHWMKLAAAYMPHVLDNTGLEVYGNSNSDEMSLAILRYLMQDNSLTLGSIGELDGNLSDPMRSRILFSKHLNDNFTVDSSRRGYVGFLTFVYPIADHSAGPYGEPDPGVYKIGHGFNEALYHKKFSRTLNEHGNYIGDVFGGFPFLIYIPGKDPKYEVQCDDLGVCSKVMIDEGFKGIAFHGPVDDQSRIGSYYPDPTGAYIGAWYLRREHLSHGCNRMDGSDVMELASLLPNLQKHRVPLTVTQWPDFVYDKNDSSLHVTDVDYYSLPTSGRVSTNDTLQSIRTRWFKEVLLPSLRRHQDAPHFDMEKMSFFDWERVAHPDLARHFGGLAVPLKTHKSRGVRIIEYTGGPSPIMQFK